MVVVLTGDEEDGQQTASGHVPFDCVIDGELLRCSLHAFLTRTGTSAESVVSIEYILARAPPQLKERAETEQWVGLALCSGRTRIGAVS